MCLWVLKYCNVSLDNTTKSYSSGLGFLESYRAWSQKKIIRCAPLFFMTPAQILVVHGHGQPVSGYLHRSMYSVLESENKIFSKNKIFLVIGKQLTRAFSHTLLHMHMCQNFNYFYTIYTCTFVVDTLAPLFAPLLSPTRRISLSRFSILRLSIPISLTIS